MTVPPPAWASVYGYGTLAGTRTYREIFLWQWEIMLEKVVLDLSSKSKVLANLCDCCHKNRVLLRLVNRCSSAFRYLPVRIVRGTRKRKWPLQRRMSSFSDQTMVAAPVGRRDFWKPDEPTRFEQSRLWEYGISVSRQHCNSHHVSYAACRLIWVWQEFKIGIILRKKRTTC
jgi:hypothetical protein